MTKPMKGLDGKGVYEEVKKKLPGKKFWIWSLSIVLVLGAIAVAGMYVINNYTVKTIYVEGNVHYSQEEIQSMVMQGPLGNNSLFLSMKYKNKEIQGVPFVDSMSVSILAPDIIKIRVYEKAVAGYVKYMNSNMYFDKDGYVVESSQVVTRGIPEIAGLSFDSCTLGQKLPVEKEEIFEKIMNITKLLNKYQLSPDRILFLKDDQITLYFGHTSVSLGEPVKLEEKLMNLPQFLSKLEGKKGVLHLEKFTGNNESVPFELEETTNTE